MVEDNIGAAGEQMGQDGGHVLALDEQLDVPAAFADGGEEASVGGGADVGASGAADPVEPDAADAAAVEVIEDGFAFGVEDHGAAQAPVGAVEGVEQQGVVGAVEAGGGEHAEVDGVGVEKGQVFGHVDIARRLAVAFGDEGSAAPHDVGVAVGRQRRNHRDTGAVSGVLRATGRAMDGGLRRKNQARASVSARIPAADRMCHEHGGVSLRDQHRAAEVLFEHRRQDEGEDQREPGCSSSFLNTTPTKPKMAATTTSKAELATL